MRKPTSHLMRKPTICICENKDADQLRGNREADQHLCFRYTDSTIPFLLKSKISSFEPSSVLVRPVATDFILVRPSLSTEGAKASAEGAKLR